ncbi:hypothetical protein DYB37_001924 [Aphanomyces astaci]|uniref:1,3-beta-glucanosyltransferase n=1 Tax=Aphanomyces astaci TaxID=112090 RepID=A0A3R7EAG5_APHAT|nr:hypothetical protein DYB35_001487 [Aphanomyces astaci]RHZ30848.1 hypothetical protein DYB37_001924 [Aphanomyces astaci]
MRIALTSFAACIALATAQTPPTTGWLNPLVTKGSKFFDSVTGAEFRVKGIAFYPRANAGKKFDANSVDWFTDDMEGIWRPHLENLKALGVNTIRMYAVDPSAPHDKFMCELNKLGICCYLLFQIDKFYLTPDNCDHDAIPCTYSKYPEFDHLAQAYNTTKPSALTLKSFEPTRKESMACPADFPTVPLPPRPNVKIFECSVYQPQCNGGSSNKQVTVQPDASTAAPKKPFGPAAAPTSAPTDPSTPGSNDASSAALTMATVGVCAAMVQFV